MKNLIYKNPKIILGALIIGVIFPFLSASAAAFNTGSADPATFQTYNFTNSGTCTSCWSSSVSANPSDVITFRIYYHNSSNETAVNTRVRVNLTSDTLTSRTLSAEVFANNSASAMGSVTINLSSAQSLTFRTGSVKWYPDRGTVNMTTRPLISGQNGSEIVSSAGLSIGDIAPGYEHDGYVTLALNVGGSNQQNGSAPIVNTNMAYSITQNSATLSGSVNPNSANATAWFEYGTTQSLGTMVGNQSIGSANSSQNITAYLSNLSQNTTYYFRTVAQNSFGTTYGAIMSFVTTYQQQQQQFGNAPIVNTNMAYSITQNSATLSGSVNPNNSNTNVWFEYGPTQYLGYTAGYQTLGMNNYLSNATAYLNNLSPNTAYYFRIAAQNAYGTNYGSMLSFNTISGTGYSGGGYYQQQNAAPSVNTLQATYVYQNSALINGSVNPSGSLTTAWFEWGRDSNLGSKSESRAVGSGYDALNFNSILSGLSAGTNYYYRAAAQNSLGTSYGNTVAIKTQSYDYTPAPEQRIITRTVAVKTGVSLDVSLDNEEVNAGDDIIISATFKNDNSSAINDLVLKIALPAEVKYLSASPRVSNRENGILTFNLGKIGAKTQGIVTVKVNVNSDAKQNSILIFGGTLEYYDKNNNFQSIESYATARVIQGEENGFGASLLDALKGIFTSPWLYIVLLLIAVGVTAWYFGKRSVMKSSL
ncbi:MAG: hypothetical protein NUV83_02045 [Candidatus Wolfebacteria bacterium]|nr:hypothetical protein [Candidatus Wolfebacteria bacterium]